MAGVRALVAAAAVALTACSFATPATTNLRTAVGAYRFADGSTCALVLQSGGLRLVDYGSGMLRQLTERPRDVFVGGPGVSVPTPVRVSIRLVHGAGKTVIGFRRGGRAATRIPLTVKPASFPSDGAQLAGRLLQPAGAGPFPAVVIVPGSVRARRDTYDLWAFFLASQGFAVLSYDKRGVGDSTGQYIEAATEANLQAEAADATAGVEWLRQQPAIDQERIGLSGDSQAGWIIVLAASQSPDVQFAAIQSGPAMSVGRQLAYSGLTLSGTTDPPPTDEQIRATLDGLPDSGYDPHAALTALQIPVLWQLGAVDKRMYTPETVADLQAIETATRNDFTIDVYPGGAHSLRLTSNGLISEERTSPGFVPDVFPDLAAWLQTHTG